MKLENTDIKGALRFLDGTNPSSYVKPARVIQEVPTEPPEITEEKSLFSFALKNYLKNERGIPLQLGYKYLKEVHFKLDDEEYYALGFQNRSGGWELRNKYYKGGIGKKDITVFEAESNKVHVFEGWSDFLSAVHLIKHIMKDNVIVLNSVNMKAPAIKCIKEEGFAEVLTYFDNDKAGEKALQHFKDGLLGVKAMNDLYQGYNDLNDKLMNRQLQR